MAIFIPPPQAGGMLAMEAFAMITRSCRLFRLAGSALVAAAMAVGVGMAEGQIVTCGVPGPDAVLDISDVGNFTPVGAYDAFTMGAYVANVGSASMQYTMCPNPHPVFGANLYRYSTVNGVGHFEQVGQSWLKHTAVAVQIAQVCTCQTGSFGLHPGCADLYSAGFQTNQGQLGPRYQINPFTGAFPAACPPHPSGGNLGRLEVALSDLTLAAGGASAPTRYFLEGQVIANDEAIYTDAMHPIPDHGNNNASNREVTLTGTAADYTIALYAAGGITQRGTPGIDRWKQIDPSVTETITDVPGEGRFYVSSKTTSLGVVGGTAMWHYEFAVFNLNSDRCAGAFTVPLPGGAQVTNTGFHAVLYRGGDGVGNASVDGTPWAAVTTPTGVTWSTQAYAANPNANAVRWSTVYNFRFDSTAAPVASGSVMLGLWKPGIPTSITAVAQVPGCSAPVFMTQPASAVACPTGSAVFTASASGGGPLNYAWQVQTAPGVWQTVANDPFPMSCPGGASGAFAYATPPFSGTVNMGIRPCPGVTSYQVRVIATDTTGCGATTSNEATYTICKADFNCSGGPNALTVQDIFDYLGAWFAQDPRADFNGIDGLTVQDVFDFIGAWFVGC